MAIDGVPKPLALALKSAAGIKTFVETGTYTGATTRWASGEFERVVTIEGYKERYTQTKASLKELDNVRCVYGDSRVKLAAELAKIDQPVIMWLDAHWCGDYEKSVGGPGECPLIEELGAVRKGDIVLIDDARLFLSPPPRPHDPAQWPNMDQIKAKLRGRYTVVFGDVIVSVPVSLASVVREFTGDKDDAPHYAVVSSNGYVNVLPGFAYLFNKHIGPQKQVKVVRYDVRPPGLPANFSQYAVGNQSEYSFTAGLAKFMDWWHHDTILLMLEDYYLYDTNLEAIASAQDAMSGGKIDKFDLTGDRAKVAHHDIGDNVVESKQDAPYRASLQAAIWRTDYLRDCLRRGAWSPWEFEKHAAQNDGALIVGTKTPALTYVNAVGGEGNKPGEYDHKKMPVWMWQELKRARVV